MHCTATLSQIQYKVKKIMKQIQNKLLNDWIIQKNICILVDCIKVHDLPNCTALYKFKQSAMLVLIKNVKMLF